MIKFEISELQKQHPPSIYFDIIRLGISYRLMPDWSWAEGFWVERKPLIWNGVTYLFAFQIFLYYAVSRAIGYSLFIPCVCLQMIHLKCQYSILPSEMIFISSFCACFVHWLGHSSLCTQSRNDRTFAWLEFMKIEFLTSTNTPPRRRPEFDMSQRWYVMWYR